MKSVFIISILLLFPLLSSASLERSNPSMASDEVKKPLSFSMWKQKKIRAAHKNYQEKLSAYKGANDGADSLHKKAKTAYQVLQYSRKLSINDYFEMYLADRFPNDINALNFAIEGMTKTQISQLLAAYQKRLQANELKPYER